MTNKHGLADLTLPDMQDYSSSVPFPHGFLEHTSHSHGASTPRYFKSSLYIDAQRIPLLEQDKQQGTRMLKHLDFQYANASDDEKRNALESEITKRKQFLKGQYDRREETVASVNAFTDQASYFYEFSENVSPLMRAAHLASLDVGTQLAGRTLDELNKESQWVQGHPGHDQSLGNIIETLQGVYADIEESLRNCYQTIRSTIPPASHRAANQYEDRRGHRQGAQSVDPYLRVLETTMRTPLLIPLKDGQDRYKPRNHK